MTNKINAPMWDQMQVFCKQIADHQIRLILHFDRILNEEVLKNAIKITIKNNPIVFAKYHEDNKNVVWDYSEINIDKMYSFQKCQIPDNLLQEFILKQINTYTGPQLLISLIRSEADVLILNCNHAITDAAGVKNFMYQLAQNYNCIAQNKTVTKQNDMPLRSLKILSKKLGVKEKFSAVKVMLSNKNNTPTFKKNIELNNLQNPGFKTYTINPVEFDKIKEFGKKYSATVNDILLTVYYYTLKKILTNSNKTNRLSYSSDLRAYLDNANYDVLSNFSAIHNIDIDNTINDFESLLKEISIITKNRKQMKYSLADFPMMAILFKTLPYKKLKGIFHKEFDKIKEGKSDASPSLSNIGIIEETKLDFNGTFPTNAYMLGGINHPKLFQITVSTYKKHMTISIGSYFDEMNNIFILNFIEGLKKTFDKEVLRDA
jgi:NRPS condensation-like uncharacterized protein